MPERIQLRRTAAWRKPDGTVIVARPTMWGNPWRVGAPGGFWLRDWPVSDAALSVTIAVEDAVDLYRRLLTGGPDPSDRLLPATLNAEGRRMIRDLLRSHASRIVTRLPELRGRDLACWCPPGCPCHADVLIELANAEGRNADPRRN